MFKNGCCDPIQLSIILEFEDVAMGHLWTEISLLCTEECVCGVVRGLELQSFCARPRAMCGGWVEGKIIQIASIERGTKERDFGHQTILLQETIKEIPIYGVAAG